MSNSYLIRKRFPGYCCKSMALPSLLGGSLEIKLRLQFLSGNVHHAAGCQRKSICFMFSLINVNYKSDVVVTQISELNLCIL